MGSSPSVLLLDDGELDDIHSLLQELDVACARVRGGAIVDGTAPPQDLLVATPRRIQAVAETLDGAGEPPIRVMVVHEDSNALRSRLRRDGFDYLVRRPVHPEALRLLMLHCIYQGEEKRKDRRVPVGRDVRVRSGLSTRRANLADLSAQGCRLLAPQPLEPGKRVRVSIPAASDAEEPVLVRGRVARVESIEREGVEQYALGVEFDKPDRSVREAIATIIEERKLGPATLRAGSDALSRPADPVDEPSEEPVEEPRTARGRSAPRGGVVRGITAARRRIAGSKVEPSRSGPAPASGLQERDETGPDASNRRSHDRARYEQKIPAFGNRALRVLVGRDLSVGGMRIDRLVGLGVGDRLHLAVYGEPGEDPLLIWGAIVRDDGAAEMGVAFDPLSAEAEAHLERLVSDLPSVESLHDSEVEAMGTVVAEIVG